jgi:hypothetical protein
VVNNPTGFLTVRSNPSPSPYPWNGRTDQNFVQRQELIGFRKTIGSTTSFSTNTLQYLSTFSRETNAPSFSPSTPTAINPNFLLIRVTNSFTRFDGTTAVVGEPLVKTRFPLSRLAWITYKGPSAVVYAANPNDPVILALTGAGVSTATIQAGTVTNLQKCFGLTFGINAGDPWTYSHGAANRILRLDEVAGREPDFFELLQAGILSASLGQNTGGGVTGGNVFPDIHMSSTMQHLLTIGACIIDQASPESIPTRIQFTGTNGNTWTAYGVKNLPYITQVYPIAGASPNNPTKWATYLLFQLWNPHQNAGTTLPAAVHLRVDGGVGIFAGGNGETWNTSSTEFINTNGTTAGQSVTLNPAANTALFSSTPAPLSNQNTTVTAAATPPAFSALYAPAIPTPTP